MRAFGTVFVLSSLFMFDAVLAAPLNGRATRHHDHPTAPKGPARTQAVVSAQGHKAPLPRVLSRGMEGSLPIGHRPSALGVDRTTTPSRRSVIHLQKMKLEERHDHINSPNMTTSASCDGKSSRRVRYLETDTRVVGQAQCCQSLHQSQDKQASFVSSLLGIVIPADNSMLGLQCTPIANLLSIAGSSTCNSKPVCCTGNE
jgi:hypothetical protein